MEIEKDKKRRSSQHGIETKEKSSVSKSLHQRSTSEKRSTDPSSTIASSSQKNAAASNRIVSKNNVTPYLPKETSKNKYKMEKIENKSNPKTKVVGIPDMRHAKSKITESRSVVVPTTSKQNAGLKMSSDKDELKTSNSGNSRTKIRSPRLQNDHPSNRITSSKEPKTADDQENDDVDYEYEDDFEDYEDDFEDDISSKIDAEIEENSIGEDSIRSTTEKDAKETEMPLNDRILPLMDSRDPGNNSSISYESRSMNARDAHESSKALEDTMGREAPRNERQKQHPQQQQRLQSSSRINFVSAEKTEAQMKFTGHVRRRYDDLKRILDLDYAKFDIYDCAPVRDYEFFMSAYGKSNRKQVQQQTRDDNIDRYAQCDEIETEDVGCQAPSNDTGIDNATFKDQEITNSKRFCRFVEKAGKLILRLLKDEALDDVTSLANKSTKSFSDSFTSLSLSKLAQKYQTQLCIVPKDRSDFLVTCHYITESLATDLVDHGLICLWNFSDLTGPEKILICNAKPCATSILPAQSELVAGCDDGSLILWDLNESDSSHGSIPWQNRDISLRSPSFDSAYLRDEYATAKAETSAPIVDLKVLGLNDGHIRNYGTSTFNYQIVVLHQTGSLTVWTVLKGIRAVGRSGEMSNDLGLRLGSSMKLVRISVIQPPRAITYAMGLDNLGMLATCLAQEPQNHQNFLVGTDNGYIFKVAKFRESKSAPTTYEAYYDAPSSVLCLSVCTFEPSYFLAGLSDGSISMYKLSFPKPLGVFRFDGSGTVPVINVHWSSKNPCSFYSLYANSFFASWDLKASRMEPLAVDPVSGVIAFDVSREIAEETTYMTFVNIDGSVDVHRLKEQKMKNIAESRKRLIGIVERL